ncbi:MAG: nicotinate-nucleotide--dimethylbenzimidazole phosphoribosyltransferase, partial [Cytophagales bacterium]|nr:nicotinate-nucleotide--dimethylbenzimidazole phosphoribosyltransferase [Cytophagales bacterium]
LNIRNEKIGKGTQSFLHAPAMSIAQCELAMERGRAIIDQVYAQGCNVVGFGEMGIGNTSAAAVLMHLISKIPLEDCVGRGTGLNDAQLSHKLHVLGNAILKNHQPDMSFSQILATFGGFEIAMMVGAILQAAKHRMVILVDGFICSVSFLCASAMQTEIKPFAIYCHTSEEKGHKRLLDYLEANPMLNLGMRLGEGTGCAVAFPIVRNAVSFINRMASFEQAGVSNKE